MLVSLPLSVRAAEPRAISLVPGITVKGTTATCTVQAIGNNTSDYLEATIKLYRGNTWIATWYEDGYGYILFSETKTVSSGYTYKLTVDLTVNGDAVPQATVYS